jgi:hypothetical protein
LKLISVRSLDAGIQGLTLWLRPKEKKKRKKEKGVHSLKQES